MDCQDYLTESVERKKGQHLQRETRGAIQHLKNEGYSNRAIARAIGCSPTTVGNELKRGTPPRKSDKGRKPGYSARRGEAVYKANRERPQSERHNGLFRAFVPKGVSMESFSPEYILAAADELNGWPRKKLGYRTPEELFDEFLDSVYAAEDCTSITQDESR